jgi:class 3 adenylate cyclase
MAFTDALGENFWLKRFLQRRKKIADRLPFELIAFNLTEREPLHIEDSLKYRLQFKNALKGYLGRSSDIFEFGNFMAKASVHEQDSQIRILSLVDLTEINKQRQTQLNWLNFSALFVFFLTLILVFTLQSKENLSLSLRNRIAFAFLIAIFLPVLSLVSIGKSFLSHEEKRLTEAAYVEMDTGLEALALRYKDAPRTLEKGILAEILDLLGPDPQTIKQAKAALDKAVEMDLMRNYVVCDNNGKFVFDNWPDIHPAFEAAIKFSIKQLAKNDEKMAQARSSPLKDVVDEELQSILDLTDLNIDLNRPSHLRYYVLQDFHTYFMTATLTIKGIPNFLYLHIPDYIVERHFVRIEFAKNLMATRTAKGNRYELQSELFFYSRYFAESHLPEKTELWDKLKEEFVRAYELKVKETGKIKLDNETFLYTIMPLRTMHRQGYIPCLLTTTRQIEARLQNLSIAIFALAAFAALGALLLSLALADSLLGPIKNIDEAAQQVGKGNLQVKLPALGNDELGRLSLTFNNMVEGLRERERMLAYVSESVREAIQDKADQSAAAGKTINATILFSDIRNFTGLTEEFPPEEIFALLNEFLGGVEPIIRENGGRIDKFIGDAVMAVFHEDSPDKHAYCAVQAAVAMKSFVRNLNLKRQKQGKFPINIGIGISTGKVLLGDVGSSRRKDLTVIGDEVNLAARLEQASKQGRHSRIIVSGSTYNYVQKKVAVEEMEIKEVRGKKQAVKIFELIKIKST